MPQSLRGRLLLGPSSAAIFSGVTSFAFEASLVASRRQNHVFNQSCRSGVWKWLILGGNLVNTPVPHGIGIAMSAGRICLTPIDDVDVLPDPTFDWAPLTGCAEWDGLVTLESVIAKRRLKLMFTVYPPHHGEFSIADADGSIIASRTPSVIKRPAIPDHDGDVVDDQLRAGRYVLRCDCTTGVKYRIDIEVSRWYAID